MGNRMGLQYTLFRPFNWIGSGLDRLHSHKEGSSRVVTQFLGHIARGEDIQLVDGGMQRRSFTDISDGISALMKIIENRDNVAQAKIYNIGNPENDISIKELAHLMRELAYRYPEYEPQARQVNIIEVTSEAYYGSGYQDLQNRIPFITNTCEELDWHPTVKLEDALEKIMVTYRGEVASAAALLDRRH